MWVLLAVGAGAAITTLVWSRTRTPAAERRLYAAILIAMQVIYLGFVAVQPSWRGFVLRSVPRRRRSEDPR